MPIISDIRLTELASHVKPPSVAGLFYPDDPHQLRDMLSQLLAKTNVNIEPPKALIVPHAGYIYSGQVAASAYATLKAARYRIKRVVLLGPAHRVYLRGMALSSNDYFATPLGRIAVDPVLREQVAAQPQVSIVDQAFAQEHCLEVQLPFLQMVLDEFTVLPLIVGDATADQVAQVLGAVWGGDETLIVISSDLSHYLHYDAATRIDRQTSDHIVALQGDLFGPEQACGARPIQGLLRLAGQFQLKAEALDVRNSGDTAGNHDRVVGYGAYAFAHANALGKQEQRKLIDLAATSIDRGFQHGRAHLPDLRQLAPSLQKQAAVFVTLMLNGRLRGCIGSVEANSPLAVGVALNAYNAAFRDPRFPALTPAEFSNIEISISVLTEKTEILFDSETALLKKLEPGVTGLVIAGGSHRALFLPSVWEQIAQPEAFLGQLKLKAGMKTNEVAEQAWAFGSITISGKPGPTIPAT
jgi:AmmeMemoRadiSam system protein B/AmmeMemoRadiSam system protein A